MPRCSDFAPLPAPLVLATAVAPRAARPDLRAQPTVATGSKPNRAPAAAATLTAPPPPDAALPQVGLSELYREMWLYAQGARGWLLLSSAMLVGSQLVKLAIPWFAAQAINALQQSRGASLAGCLPWVAAIVGASVACWLLHGPGRVIERSVAVRVRRAVNDHLFHRLVRAPLAWHEARHSAELAHRMSQASHALSNFTQSQFVYLQNAVNVVGPVVALTLISEVAGAMALAGLVGVACTIVAFDRALMRLAAAENQAERRYASVLQDALANIATVLSLRLRGSTRRLLAERLQSATRPLERSIALNEWKWCAVDLLSVALTWSLVVVYAWRSNTGGAVLLGGVFMVYQYAQQSAGVIGSLASNLQNFARIRTDYASAAPIWGAPKVPRVAAAVAQSVRCSIDVCGLGFAHASPTHAGEGAGRANANQADAALASAAEAARGSLHHISLRLRPGERVALVGPSGSGKSTLLRVLAGLYTPTQGHVEIDGVACLGAHELGACATLIPQEAQIFEATVRENIAFDLDCNDADIADAVHIGAFDSVLAGLPQGLGTPITQGGFNLSGGQRQRLCLARGVLAARGSSLLLLDEPTSALDPVTESIVVERIGRAFPEACIVASVHRMSLLDRFDRVVLLVQGRIVDTGSVAELAQRQPVFREQLRSEPSEEPAAA